MKAIQTLVFASLVWVMMGEGLPSLASAQTGQGDCLTQCMSDFIGEVSVVAEEFQACVGEFCLQNPDDPSCERIIQRCVLQAQPAISNATEIFKDCVTTCGVQLPPPGGNGGGGDSE